jgi:ABC-type transport system involved in multi-copper enzyme maturation permease subunit
MTHVLAIARREIEERAFVFIAAVAIALVSLVVLVIPYGSLGDRKSGVVMLGFFLGVAFTWALALILGATLVGRELSEKRLSFYFTRPVSGSAIWFGKLLAALVLLAASFAIVNAIPLGIGGHEWESMSTYSRLAAMLQVAGIAILLLLVAHVVSTWVRSRSRLLAIDFVATLIVIALCLGSIAPLLVAAAFGPALNVVALFILAIVVACVAGGAIQLSRGRIDARRSHRELSAFVWLVVGIAALSAFGYSRWTLGATPRDFHSVGGVQHGNMAEVWGTARGYQPGFIVNLANGAFARSSGVVGVAGDTVASIVPGGTFMNARRIVGGNISLGDNSVVVTRLDATPRVVWTLPINGKVTTLGVNPDGSRLAVVADRILTVYDTNTRSALASTRLVTDHFAQFRFLSDSVMRAFVPFGDGLRVRDFDLHTRTWRDVAGPFPIQNQHQYEVFGPMVITASENSVEIHNLTNPALDRVIPIGPDTTVWTMSDGRLAVAHRGRPAYLEIQSKGAQPRLVHFSGDTDTVRVAGEAGAGKLLVTTHRHGKEWWDPTTYIIDADSGAITRTFAHAMTAVTFGPGASSAEDRYRALFHRDTGKIDVVDLQTGAIRPLY